MTNIRYVREWKAKNINIKQLDRDPALTSNLSWELEARHREHTQMLYLLKLHSGPAIPFATSNNAVKNSLFSTHMQA